MYCIYKAVNKKNGKTYIGKTNNFEKRKREHFLDKRTNSIFDRALRKHGDELFEWSILENHIPTLKAANEREQYWIKQYNAYFRWDDSNGYNMTCGGEGGNCWNVRKVAVYNLQGEYQATYGSLTECADALNIGGTSDISNACNDNTKQRHGYMFRYCEPNETPPNKIEPYHFDNGRKVRICQLSLDGSLLRIYSGIVDAEKEGYRHTGILGCIKGRYRSSYGFQWCYEKDLQKHIGQKVEPIIGTKIQQYTLDGQLVGEYNSCAEAARQNGWEYKVYKNIHKALSTETHNCRGYVWLKSK